MTVSGSNLISITGNHGSILRSLREYLGLLEGGGFGQNRALTSRGGIAMIGGLVPSNTGDVGGDDLTFSPGVCRASNSDGETAILSLTASMNKLGDTAWAKGTGAGMLDTGAIADDTYHDFLIGNPQTREVDILRSLSATAPTMPSGWTYKRRIFSSKRISGANQAFTALEISGGGLEVLLKVPIFEFIKSWAGGADDTAQTGTLAQPPTGIQVEAILAGLMTDSTPAAASAILITSTDQTDTAADAAVTSYVGTLRIPPAGAGVNAASAAPMLVRTSTTATFRYRAIGSTTDHRFSVMSQGWVDSRLA